MMKLKSGNNQKYRNKLADQSSPYLLQHAANPVDWYPWGEEAFEKARTENKPLLISIGYAACHWCHVMEHESFEDIEVADFMNKNFVCIKVDREERPDVDQVYMNAVQLMTGRGGWPLNCFALPDGKPFYGGTYFTKKNWLKLLQYLSDVYRHEREKILQQAEQILSAFNDLQNHDLKDPENSFNKDFIVSFSLKLMEQLDFQEGGTRGAPKFPMPGIGLYLLRYYYLTRNEKALEWIDITLQEMARGGIYDHLGGGFARYSVDGSWHVPHFEKMLYDNAQLISLYSEAYRITKNPVYKQVVYETTDFVINELTSPEGVFFSSLDADSEGEEGLFYVWEKQQIIEILGLESPLICDYFDITEKGNWEYGKNILHITKPLEEISLEKNIPVHILSENLDRLKSLLLAVRSHRTRPGLDNKVLTSWNALMIKGLTDAYKAFGDTLFLDHAIRAADFITEKMSDRNKSLFRNYMHGKASIHAFLDDYALLIDSLISLYQCTFEEKWLFKAFEFNDYVLTHFADTESVLFFYTDQDYHDVIVRKPEQADNVIPSSNSVMAQNLFLLGKYFDKPEYIERSKKMLVAMKGQMLQFPSYHTQWAISVLNQVYPFKEVVIMGKGADNLRVDFERHYIPNIVLAGAKEKSELSLTKHRFVENKTYFYVCENNTCQLPVETVEEALYLINKYAPTGY